MAEPKGKGELFIFFTITCVMTKPLIFIKEWRRRRGRGKQRPRTSDSKITSSILFSFGYDSGFGSDSSSSSFEKNYIVSSMAVSKCVELCLKIRRRLNKFWTLFHPRTVLIYACHVQDGQQFMKSVRTS